MMMSYTNIPCLGLSTWCNRISWAVESSKTILDKRSAPSCMATRSSGNPSSSSINDLPTNNYESLYYKGVTLCLLLLTVNLPEKLTVTHLVQKYFTSRKKKNLVFWDVMLCCWVSSSWHFHGIQCLHVQGQTVQNTYPLKIKAPWFLKTLRTTCPVVRHNIPEDSAPHKHCCEDLKYCTKNEF
jgi:hypothetical protein